METKIEIFQSEDKEIELQVKLEKETVWLNRQQLAKLFDRDIKTIGKHIGNVLNEEELDSKVVVAKFATTTEHGAIKGKTQSREVEYFNLDMIISVGYRVNSKRGTQFRQWATQRLKDYLIQGYTINQKRLDELGQIVNVIKNSANADTIHLKEARGLLEIIADYTQSFILLNKYDSNKLQADQLKETITFEIKYDEAKSAIHELKSQLIAKKEATELFGKEKDGSFIGILGNIVQSFGSQYLYPSIEEQAAHLLYFVIKNHPFSDGNKRIGAFLFIWFLEKNKHLFKKSGELKINDNGLIALALLVAQSDPVEKELMIKLIINLINDAH